MIKKITPTRSKSKMRILLLRVFITSWMIPLCWILLFPIIYLLGGYWEAKYLCSLISKEFWTGVSEK